MLRMYLRYICAIVKLRVRRNPEAIHLAPNAKRRFLWIHDPQLGPTDMDYYSEEYEP